MRTLGPFEATRANLNRALAFSGIAVTSLKRTNVKRSELVLVETQIGL